MQVEALRIFCDVVRLKSFSRGAEANRVLQSSASQTVHGLEEHLGVMLIDRSRRPWRLTEEGRLFYEGCREVLERYTDLETEIKRIHDEVDSVVRVAAIYSVGLGDMSQFVQQFSAANHGARVQVEYLHPDRVYQSVLDEVVDFGIVSYPRTRKELTVVPWREEAMVLACPPGHRLSQQKKVSAVQIAGEKFVGFERGLPIRKEIDRYLKRNAVAVDVVMEFDNIEAVKRGVEVGSGVSILPEPTLRREVESGTLVAVPFAAKNFVRPLGIIHRRGRKFYPSTQRFMDLLLNGGNGGRRGNGH